MSKYRVSQTEIFGQLREQNIFLSNSARLFDEGVEPEAKRIATSIRVLLHDTQKSTSLLNQLGQKSTLLFWSTGIPYNPGNLSPFHGLLNIVLPSLQYTPKLDPQPRVRLPFDQWWNEPVLKEAKAATLFSRKDLVLALANKDGGAHVDPELEEAYFRCSFANTLTMARESI